MDSKVIVAILEMVAKYGIPAVVESINTLGKETVTIEDIEALGNSMDDPAAWRKGE